MSTFRVNTYRGYSATHPAGVPLHNQIHGIPVRTSRLTPVPATHPLLTKRVHIPRLATVKSPKGFKDVLAARSQAVSRGPGPDLHTPFTFEF